MLSNEQPAQTLTFYNINSKVLVLVAKDMTVIDY